MKSKRILFRIPKMPSAAHSRVPNAKSTVQSLAKGFRVLEAFDAHEPEQNLARISERAGLDPGTAFRLVKTLVMLGYLRQVDGVKRYRLAPRVLDLGFHAIAGMDLHECARPILRSLVGQVNEAASISVLEGSDIVYIERVQAGFVRLGVNVRIGSRIPAYCTAAGHAILAHLSPARRTEVLRARERIKITPSTLTGIAQIEQRLKSVRQQGYALSDQETVPGLRVMAAPILDADGHPFGAISVAGPSVACTLQDFIAASAEPLRRAAGELSRILRISGSASP